MPTTDMPKIWVDEEEEQFDPITGEIIPSNTQMLMPVEEEEIVPLPTIEEQKAIISTANISEENRGMLNALVEMNAVADALVVLRDQETRDKRKTVIDAFCENFVQSRMMNNVMAEKLKSKLLERLLNNVTELDLETSSRIYNDLSDVSSVDAQQAMAIINGGASNSGFGQQGTTVNVNLATAEGAQVVNNTLNANPQQVTQLKEVATLNSSIKAWNNIPLPKKND